MEQAQVCLLGQAEGAAVRSHACKVRMPKSLKRESNQAAAAGQATNTHATSWAGHDSREAPAHTRCPGIHGIILFVLWATPTRSPKHVQRPQQLARRLRWGWRYVVLPAVRLLTDLTPCVALLTHPPVGHGFGGGGGAGHAVCRAWLGSVSVKRKVGGSGGTCTKRICMRFFGAWNHGLGHLVNWGLS